MRPLQKKQFLALILGAGLFCAPNRLHAQAADTQLPDSPSQVAQAQRPGGDAASERQVSWRSLPMDFLHDQKGIWLFPLQLGKGHYWLPTLAVAGGTAGLIIADPHVMPYFRSHQGNLDDVNDVFDAQITTATVIAIPTTLMIAGYARHDDYQVGTALLSAEAYADSAVVDLAVKAITRRQRPSDVPPGAPFTNTFFAGGKSPFKGSSFPLWTRGGCFFRGHSRRQSLSQPPLGAVGDVWFCHCR